MRRVLRKQRLRVLGYKVSFVTQAVAFTFMPEIFAGLVRQRLRWDRDALAIRIFMYKQFSARAWNQKLGDTF